MLRRGSPKPSMSEKSLPDSVFGPDVLRPREYATSRPAFPHFFVEDATGDRMLKILATERLHWLQVRRARSYSQGSGAIWHQADLAGLSVAHQLLACRGPKLFFIWQGGCVASSAVRH